MSKVSKLFEISFLNNTVEFGSLNMKQVHKKKISNEGGNTSEDFQVIYLIPLVVTIVVYVTCILCCYCTTDSNDQFSMFSGTKNSISKLKDISEMAQRPNFGKIGVPQMGLPDSWKAMYLGGILLGVALVASFLMFLFFIIARNVKDWNKTILRINNKDTWEYGPSPKKQEIIN